MAFLETGEWDAILDLADQTLKAREKANARLEAHRARQKARNAPQRAVAAPSSVRTPSKRPKASQNRGNRAKRGAGERIETIEEKADRITAMMLPGLPKADRDMSDGRAALIRKLQREALAPDLARHLNPQLKPQLKPAKSVKPGR